MVVVGAGSKQGSSVVCSLLQTGAFTVKALTKNSDDLSAPESACTHVCQVVLVSTALDLSQPPYLGHLHELLAILTCLLSSKCLLEGEHPIVASENYSTRHVCPFISSLSRLWCDGCDRGPESGKARRKAGAGRCQRVRRSGYLLQGEAAASRRYSAVRWRSAGHDVSICIRPSS